MSEKIKLYENVKRIKKRLRVAEAENERLRGLLKVAKCPNCDGSGAIPIPYPDLTGEGELWDFEQCQWCDERSTIFEKKGD